MDDQSQGLRLDPDPVAVAAQQAAAQAKAATIAGFRDLYATTTQQFCAVAGLTPVNVLTVDAISSAIQAQTLGSPTRMQLDELAAMLEALTVKLISLDGPDALDRIS